MGLKRSVKIESGFNMSAMSDMVFQILLFFMLSSTLISPNALPLQLPRSNSQVKGKPMTTVSITKDLTYYVESTPVPFSQLESVIQQKLMNDEDPTLSLHADKSVPIDEVVKVMNIARNNRYKLILATSAEQ